MIILIKKLNYGHIVDVSYILQEALPSSVPAILGFEFLSRFYFKNIIKTDKIFGLVYEYNNKILGYITYSIYSGSILLNIIKKNFIPLCLLLIKEIIKNPRKIKIILTLNFLLFQQKKILPQIHPEIVSFGVLPEYRTSYLDKSIGKVKKTEFYKKHNIKVAEELLIAALKNLNKLGAKEIKIVTEKNNIASNKFYSKYCQPVAVNFKFLGSEICAYKLQIKNILKKFNKSP